MASEEELVLDLDSEDERPTSANRTTKGRNTTTRGPRTRIRRSVTNEADDDDVGPSIPGVKHERCDSAIPDESSPKKRQKPEKASEKPPVEIVAINFGMWGIDISSGPPLGHPHNVKARKKWPKDGGAETSKLPAVTALPEDNEGHEKFIGREEAYTGFEVQKGMTITAYSKLCMARTISPSPLDDRIFQQNIAKKLLRPSEPAKYRKAMVHLLKYVHKIYREEVTKSLGRPLQPDDSFHYVFTYPAACSEAGRRTLRDSVKKAGFEDRDGNKITYISEAHAAASAAFIDSRWMMNLEDFKKVFKKGKAVTVLDCGALTVDATTITMLGTDSKLRIAETCVSNGGNCGTTAIISRILKVFEAKFGAVFAAIPSEQLDRGTNFYKDCESILRNYDGASDGEIHKFSLKMPDGFVHPDYHPRTGEIILHDSEVQQAFSDNFEYVKAIVRDQWQKMLQKTDVIATGGGSLCPYIDKMMEKFCREHGIRYIRMLNRDSAVCRGALINAMNEDFFGYRLSRAYFGILVREKGRTYIKWFVYRGQQINVKKGLVIKKCPGQLKLNDSTIRKILYGMDLRRPHLTIYTFQGHLEDDQNPPDQPADIGVEKVGRVVIDGSGFSQSFKTKLEKAMRNGDDLSIKTTVSVRVDESGRLSFVAKSGHIHLGQGELRYDATEVDPQPTSW